MTRGKLILGKLIALLFVVDRVQLDDGGLYRGLVNYPAFTYIVRLLITVLGELIVVRKASNYLQIVTS